MVPPSMPCRHASQCCLASRHANKCERCGFNLVKSNKTNRNKTWLVVVESVHSVVLLTESKSKSQNISGYCTTTTTAGIRSQSPCRLVVVEQRTSKVISLLYCIFVLGFWAGHIIILRTIYQQIDLICTYIFGRQKAKSTKLLLYIHQ